MVNCCIPGCTSSQRKCKDISFHDIPANMEQREHWLRVIAREDWLPNDNSNSSRVCSVHFLPEDYKTNTKRKFLLPGAVPSVFPSSPSYKQPVQKRLSTSETTEECHRRTGHLSPAAVPCKHRVLAEVPAANMLENRLHDVDSQLATKKDATTQADFLTRRKELVFEESKRDRQGWKSEKALLMRRVHKLQKRLDSARAKFVKYKKSYNGRDFASYRGVLQAAIAGEIGALLLVDQVKNYKRKRPNWCETTLQHCTLWRALSPGSYRYVRENHLFRLPTRSTLQRFSGSINVEDDMWIGELQAEPPPELTASVTSPRQNEMQTSEEIVVQHIVVTDRDMVLNDAIKYHPFLLELI